MTLFHHSIRIVRDNVRRYELMCNTLKTRYARSEKENNNSKKTSKQHTEREKGCDIAKQS